MTEPLARLMGVHKRFGKIPALRGADLTVHAGEIHGVLGENGAGKTTLLNVLAGMFRPDAGEVEIGGVRRRLRRPRDAWSAGVGMVHQHFALVPALSVLDNLALGLRSSASGMRHPGKEVRRAAEVLVERTGLGVPLDAPVEGLGVGVRQRVEILKALLRRPRILVLDEPTAVLAPTEVDALFDLLRELASEGRGVVLVAHKLDEVLAVAHRVTVLRLGRSVLTAPRDEVDAPGLTRAMVGSGVVDAAAVGHGAALGGAVAGPGRRQRKRDPGARGDEGDGYGEVVARLRDVGVRRSRGDWALDGASLEVRRGEVVGIAGVEGNGQRELALVLAGILAPERGERTAAPGVGFVSQDRTREGLVGTLDLTANVALALHRDPAYRKGPLLRWDSLRGHTRTLMERFDVRAPGPGAWASSLSGGNQQRLVVARELEVASDLLVAESPTRGLDVAAAAFVHETLAELAGGTGGDRGPGVVLVSTDLDEVLALSHRILVMSRGRLMAVPGDRHTREDVGTAMLAGTRA